MSILTFNFYIDQVICDQIYKENQTGEIPASGIIFKRKACYNPTFITQLSKNILQTNPELVVITTEGESGYFHTDFLPDYMYYSKSYNLLSHKQYNQLDMSIYVRNDHYQLLEYKYDTNGYTDSMVQYVRSAYGNIGFIGLNRAEEADLENTAKTLIDTTINQYKKSDYYFLMAHIPENGVGIDEELDHNYVTYGGHGLYDLIETSNDIVHYNVSHVGMINHFEFVEKNSKILCFCWNTDKTPLCDRNYGGMDKQHRKRFFSSDECYNPLFFDQIENEIVKYQPDVVAISNEGDLKSGTFFHYQYLPAHMKRLNYYLLDNSKANDIGINQDSLRLSIYARNDLDLALTHINKSLFSYNENYSCGSTKNKAKAIVKYVETAIGIIAFMAVQMPHEYTSVEIDKCLLNMQNKLLNKKIAYTFILGEFNYSAVSNTDPDSLQNAFRLKLPALIDYEEGNYIYPNYNLKPIMGQNYQLSRNSYHSMTWHDRIYYKTADTVSHDLVCLLYNTLMGFPILHQGNHLGVYGVYEFQKIGINPTSFKNISDRENVEVNNSYEYEEDFSI